LSSLAPIEVSVVVPVRDEEENLARLVAEIQQVFSLMDRSYEMIFVDDGSRDGSLQVMRDLQGAAQELRILAFAHNCGQSAALDAGFKAARGNVVVTMDGDLQNDPRDIPRLMEALEKADVVVGWRVHRRDSLVKRWTSRAGNHIRNLLTHEKIRDTGCSLKAFRRNVLEEIKLFKGMHRFLPTLARMGGFSVVEIKVNHRPREHGKTKYGIFDRLWVTVPDLFAVRWMQRRSLRYEVREEHS
jgi:dolichol-phosphate mannosyltransferase